MEEKKNNISRRDFLKAMSAAGLATAGLVACGGNNGNTPAGTQEPTGEMPYRTNPTSGDRVSLLGFGMMRLPSVGGRSAREGNEEIDQEMVNQMVDYAIAHGVNYFDTSPAYCRGLSERATGIALSRHPRDSYFVATKLSLEERRAGRIRNLGFSYHGDIRVFDYLLSRHDYYKWDFVQIQLNYLDWKYAKQINPRNTDAEYLYGELQKRHIPAVIMEPLLGGRLSNVPDNIVARLKQREPERSVASWAFRFAGSFPDVLTVLSGMTRMEHLQDNLRTYSPLKPLSEEEFNFLQDTATMMMQFDTIPCNDCKYCMPCPYGIDIPAVLLHYNKCLNEGNIPASSQDPGYRNARRAFLVGYDRSVPRLRQASHCIGCNQCSPHCPQRINIPAEMQRIDHYVERLKQNNL